MSQTLPSSTAPRSGAVVWALILIAAGVIWLLREANIFTAQNMAVLLRLWPVILIAIGVELLIGRGSRSMSMLIVGATIVVLLALMFVGPAIGLAPNVEVKTMSIDEPLGDATSARMNLGIGVGTTTVSALQDSGSLIQADLRYAGDVQFNVEPGAQADITLSNSSSDANFGFDFFGWTLAVDERDLRWDVRLTPSIPLDLRVSGGVGSATVDLTGLQVTNVVINTGVGEQRITLPSGEGVLPVEISGGVGKTVLTIPAGAGVTADINAGVGETVIDVAGDAAVRLRADGGLGGVNVPAGWERISGEDRNGVWESPTFSDAATEDRIDIDYNGGVGSLRID
ncbi:MAG: hypothetical protein IPK19_03705 [Chloroflexi bacterium]|nr:hypothetical protein [Chloroflexota bacterium]